MRKIQVFLSVFICVICGYVFIVPLSALPPISGDHYVGKDALGAREAVIAAAEAYLGTPYKYGGMTDAGMDCSGLVYASFKKALKVTPPRTVAAIYAWTEKIADADIRPGDLVFFITGGGGEVSHVGIYTGDSGGGRFIHSASDGPETGVMYSSFNDAYWERTYTGAGRALPWDGVVGAVSEGVSQPADAASLASPVTPAEGRKWNGSRGAFIGGALAWNFGGLFKGSPSLFRGVSGQVKIGYKGFFGSSYQAALEIRPGFDRALGVGRLPVTVSAGTDNYQVFFGPVFTFGGDAVLDTEGGRAYYPRFTWFGELGFSAALNPISIGRGALTLFIEAAWQPYARAEGADRDFWADLTANYRFSAGLRYVSLF